MPFTFHDDTGGNIGVHRKLTVAEGDGNVLEAKDRIEALEGLTGLRIADVTSTPSSFTFHFVGGSSQTIALPIAAFHPAGSWLNDHFYNQYDAVAVRHVGFFVVLQPHTTPALPAVFDPNATDGTTSARPLYMQIGTWLETDYDFVISLPGTQLYVDGAIVAQFKVPRPIELDAAALLSSAYAYLATPTEGIGTDPTALEIGIFKNATSIGSITFSTGVNEGAFTFAATIDFVAGDLLVFKATRADDAAASDLSITVPAVRTDV